MDSLSFLQGIFPTQELNRGLLHCRQILHRLSHQGSHGLNQRFSKFGKHLEGSYSRLLGSVPRVSDSAGLAVVWRQGVWESARLTSSQAIGLSFPGTTCWEPSAYQTWEPVRGAGGPRGRLHWTLDGEPHLSTAD